VSLRARVLAGLALVAVVMVTAAVLVTRTTEAHLVDQVDAQLVDARAQAGRFDLGRVGGGLPGPRPDDGGPHLSTLYVAYIAPGGVTVALSRPDLRGDEAPTPSIDADRARQASHDGDPFTAGSTASDGRYRVLATAAPRTGGTVVIAAPLDDVDAAVHRLIAVEAGATVLVLAVLGLVGWWVVHLGVRPIKQMTTTASAIAGGELSHRVPEGDPRTEAGKLGSALNQMLGRIEEAFDERARSADRLRQFVADASHELRTPVTTIRGYAELYRAGGLDDDADLRGAMRRTEQEAVRMGALVDDLLELARLDAGRPLASERVDLSKVVDDAVRDARAVDPERPVVAGHEGPVVTTGDEARLRQVTANLVGNALVHTPPGTPVEVRASATDGWAVLEVHDDGPGMAPDVAARAFERFFRADPSRSRHRGGSGLGLSIVESTVRAHGGEVELDTGPGRGTTVRVRLPRHP
jgi:two-component system OmpR family sensor kinase